MKNEYMSNLKSNSGHGAGHWIKQRISAVIIMLFTLSAGILIYNISKAMYKAEVIDILKLPQNIIISAVFFLSSLYHAALGVQVIIEDYMACIALRKITILLMQIISITTAVSFMAALIYLMSI